MPKRIAFGISMLLVLATVTVAQDDPAKQKAIADMHQIADAIRACPEEIQEQADYGIYYWGPPVSLEWDVVPSKTVRSPFQGFVEFTLQHREVESDAAKR